MALMEWDNSFSVNVAEIDGQHKILVEMLNTLNDTMKARKGTDKKYSSCFNENGLH